MPEADIGKFVNRIDRDTFFGFVQELELGIVFHNSRIRAHENSGEMAYIGTITSYGAFCSGGRVDNTRPYRMPPSEEERTKRDRHREQITALSESRVWQVGVGRWKERPNEKAAYIRAEHFGKIKDAVNSLWMIRDLCCNGEDEFNPSEADGNKFLLYQENLEVLRSLGLRGHFTGFKDPVEVFKEHYAKNAPTSTKD